MPRWIRIASIHQGRIRSQAIVTLRHVDKTRVLIAIAYPRGTTQHISRLVLPKPVVGDHRGRAWILTDNTATGIRHNGVIQHIRRGLDTVDARAGMFDNDVVPQGWGGLVQEDPGLPTTAHDKTGEHCSRLNTTRSTHHRPGFLAAIKDRSRLTLDMDSRFHGHMFKVDPRSDEHRISSTRGGNTGLHGRITVRHS